MIDEIKACRKRPKVEEILIPGEKEFRTALENRKLGIPIGDQTFKELEALCEEYEIPFKLKEKKPE
jgi:LDH2 family malate/lactate/ureidoglycolate dehydrogenase